MWWLWTIVLNTLLVAAGQLVAKYGLRLPKGPVRIAATAFLAWSWAVLGVEFTGLVGWLHRTTLLVWSIAFFLFGLALRFRPNTAGPPRTTPDRPRLDLPAVLSLGLLLWASVWLGSQSLEQAVKVVSDGPIYHLYFAVRWWQDGRLSLIPTPFGENAAPYFPANGDLWFTWLVTCWGGDRLARVGQAPAVLVAGLVVYALARRLCAAPSAAAIATACFLGCTPLLLFSFEPNVDTIFIAAYLLAVYCFVVYAADQDRWPILALGGLAAGGALGTKATGIVFVPPLLALAALGVWRSQRATRRRWRHLAILAGSSLVLSAFWFARNAWLTGNPLYPLHLELVGKTVLAGWYGPDVMRLSQYYVPVSNWRAAFDILLAVGDPRLMPLWLLALAGAWAVGPGRNPQPVDRWVWLCAGLAVVNLALYWLLIPYRTQQRFVLHALGLAAVPLARLLDRAAWLRWVGAGLLALHMLTPQGWPVAAAEREIPWDLSPAIPNAVGSLLPFSSVVRVLIAGSSVVFPGLWLLLGLGALMATWLWRRWAQRPTPGRAAAASALLLATCVGTGLLTYPWGVPERWQFYPNFPDYQRGWTALERVSPAQGTSVAYAGTNLPYYLMASGLRNQVRYVNINAHPGWLLHDYHLQARASGHPTWSHPRPGWDRTERSYQAWLQNLRAQGVQLLVVARANPNEGPHNIADAQQFPIERTWAEAHPEAFTPLYGVRESDPEFRIYSFRSP